MQGKFKNSVHNILILAARQGRANCVCLLIDEYGADVNFTSNMKKHSSLHFAAYNGDKELAKELLVRGAKKDLKNVYEVCIVLWVLARTCCSRVARFRSLFFFTLFLSMSSWRIRLTIAL